MGLQVVPDLQSAVPGPVDLSEQIGGLTRLVDEALSGGDVENADGLAKLVNALARLIDAQEKAKETVTKAELTRFVAGMAESIGAHVTSPEVRGLLQRDWRRLMDEVAG